MRQVKQNACGDQQQKRSVNAPNEPGVLNLLQSNLIEDVKLDNIMCKHVL